MALELPSSAYYFRCSGFVLEKRRVNFSNLLLIGTGIFTFLHSSQLILSTIFSPGFINGLFLNFYLWNFSSLIFRHFLSLLTNINDALIRFSFPFFNSQLIFFGPCVSLGLGRAERNEDITTVQLEPHGSEMIADLVLPTRGSSESHHVY